MHIQNDGCAPLIPAEWDFRGLESEDVLAALSHELDRENAHVPEAMALLTLERLAEMENLTAEALDAWCRCWVDQKRFGDLSPVFDAVWRCREFPRPWMCLSHAQRMMAKERCLEPTVLGVLSRDELRKIEDMCQLWSQITGKPFIDDPPNWPVRRYIVQIDWAHDDSLLKPLLLGLLKLRPENIHPHKRHTGKRAGVPWHKLKQLAAWRLAKKAGLSHKQARSLVERRRRDAPHDDPRDVLPSYTSAGAWKGAVDAGARLVKRGAYSSIR